MIAVSLLAELFWQVYLRPDSPGETVGDDATGVLAGRYAGAST